jgi:transcriptional regulator with XRE-family HTH domain
MSKKDWLNDAAELRGFLSNRNIDAKQFATRAGMTPEQLERVLSGKKAIDIATAEKIIKAKKAYPLTKQVMDIQIFVKRLRHAWHFSSAHIARSEVCNMFIVALEGLEDNSDLMRSCVDYSGWFEQKFSMALLFVDAKHKKTYNFIWEELLD